MDLQQYLSVISVCCVYVPRVMYCMHMYTMPENVVIDRELRILGNIQDISGTAK